jgi:hypothetical protein
LKFDTRNGGSKGFGRDSVRFAQRDIRCLMMMMMKRAAYEDGFEGIDRSSGKAFASRLRVVRIECRDVL